MGRGRSLPELWVDRTQSAEISERLGESAGRGMNLGRLNDVLKRRTGEFAPNRVLVESVDSTNNLALRLVRSFLDRESLPPKILVVALEQRSGRGRQGRRWVSPGGQGVYLSLVVASRGPDDLASLPLLVGVGLGQTISEICSCSCQLKWPNDLLVDGRKVGGILIDCISRGVVGTAAVIGIGVNYRRSHHVAEAGGVAMDEIARELPDFPAVLSELVVGVEQEMTHLGDMGYAARRFREMSVHRPGDTVQYRTDEGLQRASFSGLDERGFLVLENDQGMIRLSAGEAIEEWREDDHES